MAVGGSYRIESTLLNKEFQAPVSAWTEQQVSIGLNGIPINTGYRIHTWNLNSLIGCDHTDLMTLFETQQDNNTQLTEIETDAYNSSEANERYGTTVYTDFVILSIEPKQRGFPLYENVTVTFEIFVS